MALRDYMYILDKDAHISVRITQSKYKKLKEVAKKNDIKVSDLIRYIVDHYLMQVK